jgi:medium-chain acyl-[acyl-carrier-protein] hydrolase
MMESPCTKERHIVSSFDADVNRRLKISALFQYYQEAAGNDAKRLGVGYDDVHPLGLFWVLSRVLVRVRRLPAWGESVTIVTWPKGHEGLSFLRDFQLLDSEEKELIAGTSAWLILDHAKGRPHSADALPVVLPHAGDRHALNEPMPKLKPFLAPFGTYDRKVVTSDLDMNSHVNNARYVEWGLDAYTPEFLSTQSVKTFQIHYTGEAHFGDLVRVSAGTEEGGGRHSIEAVKLDGGGKFFQAQIEWEGK